jgi:hypothetical protein
VTDAKGVVFAFAPAGKRRQPVTQLDRLQQAPASGQDLVGVSLVADVPDEPVVRRVEHVMQGHRQLDGAQTRRKVPAHLAHGLHEELAQLVGNGAQLGDLQASQVHGRVDPGQQRVTIVGAHLRESLHGAADPRLGLAVAR